MTTAIITETTLRESEQKALTVPDQARALIIATNEQYAACEEYLSLWKEFENQIHADHDPIAKKLHSAHKDAVALRDKYLSPIEEGRRILKPKMVAYQQDQERIRLDAQRKAEEEARKRAEQESLDAALVAEACGDTEAAEAIISEPVYVAPVIIPRSAPAPSRLSAGRTVWSASVSDLKKLCVAVGNGTASTEFVMGLEKKNNIITSPALNRAASAMKNTLAVAGVVAVSRTV